ncbi:hypothetical protein OIY81_1167 [Cryptosporidium canis]|uniref:Uncharacterized protein n=1 Tax=Cryptosporidium canis TaxID=195482 RepID=A0ABQ8P7Z7_9CRYT|nr:hypothetical protein OJ252_1499 [Cryptosporidium canis]KAJ1612802.1 hypothetical protein OIY81_1167 [Cryptosporidium canis]
MASIEAYREAISVISEYITTKYGPEEENVINMILEAKGIPGIFRGQSVQFIEGIMAGRRHGGTLMSNSIDYEPRAAPIDSGNGCNMGLNVHGMIPPMIHDQIIHPPVPLEIQSILQSGVQQSAIQPPIMNQQYLQPPMMSQSMHSLASTNSPSMLNNPMPASTIIATSTAATTTTTTASSHINTSLESPSTQLEKPMFKIASMAVQGEILSDDVDVSNKVSRNPTNGLVSSIPVNSSSVSTGNNQLAGDDYEVEEEGVQEHIVKSACNDSEDLTRLKENQALRSEISSSNEVRGECVGRKERIGNEAEEENDIEDISEKIRNLLRMATSVNELNQAIKMAYSAGLTYEAGLGERKLKKLLC